MLGGNLLGGRTFKPARSRHDKEWNMLRTFKTGSVIVAAVVLGGLAYAQTTPAPKPGGGAMKLSQAECLSLWNRLDTAKSGSITAAQARPHVTDFKAVDANNDGKLSETEFRTGCERGQVHASATTGPGSGAPDSQAPKK
jgi:EF hand